MAERKSARQRAAPKRPAAKRARETASTPPSRSQVQDAAPAAGVPANPRPFIVGIGASAGGLEALSELLEHLPADSGMVFVVVTHEDPDRVSPLPMLLQRHTDMRVSAISDGMPIAPNQVYVAPPVGQLALFNGAFHLMDHTQRHGTRLPIDYFFRALAEDQEEKAIGIVLSGTGSDGTLGLLAIKIKGGLAMAQSVASAKFTGMPRSAIDTGRVDMALAPREMPAQLLAYASNRPFRQTAAPMADENPALAEVLPKIFLLLRHHTGHDFSSYKTSTIQRRIARRMHVHQIETPAQYLRFLQETPHELDILFQEFLISVTQFFRDPEAFDVLARSILPQYLETHPAGMPIRVWVPGCATGEEAYSLGIVLYEAMEQASRHDPVQIFGTDLDARAIAMARQGRYPVGIAADMSPERLARFFTHEDATYQVRKPIRDIVVFATQNLLKDPHSPSWMY